MKHITDRLAVLAGMTDDEVSLVLWRRPQDCGLWLASICPFGSKIPLLDSHANESLAALGSSPMGALAMLNARLEILP